MLPANPFVPAVLHCMTDAWKVGIKEGDLRGYTAGFDCWSDLVTFKVSRQRTGLLLDAQPTGRRAAVKV